MIKEILQWFLVAFLLIILTAIIFCISWFKMETQATFYLVFLLFVKYYATK